MIDISIDEMEKWRGGEVEKWRGGEIYSLL
jgi:hypothetical protein